MPSSTTQTIGTSVNLIEDLVTEIQNSERLDNRREAMARFFLMNRFGLTESEAGDALIMAGQSGRGIDAVHFEEDAAQINVVQFHYEKNAKGQFGKPEIAKLQATIESLQDAELVEQISAPEVQAVLREIHDRRSGGYDIVIYVVVWGQIDDDAQTAIRSFSESDDGFPILGYDQNMIVELAPTRRERENINAVIEPVGGEIVEHQVDGRKALVFTVEASALAVLRGSHGDQLFSRNVRYYLGNKGANKGMLESLRTPDGRRNFWFYHNGITGICTNYEEKDGKIDVHNLQVVNGCQTTVTLHEALYVYQTAAEQPTLVMRLIQTGEDDSFLNHISRYTNTQSAVTDQDLASNDRIQEQIQEAFARAGYFYERARGEWKTLSLDESQQYAKAGGGERMVSNGDIAKATMIWIGLPAEAKSQRKQHFLRRAVGGYYEKIFDPNRSVAEYLLAYHVMRYAEERRKAFSAELRDAAKSDYAGLSDDDRGMLEAREYLLHAETHVAAFISEVLRDKVSPANYDKLVKLLEEDNTRPLDHLFTIMDQVLANVYREKLRQQSFQFSKYFKNKGTWEEFRTHLRSQFRTLDMLSERGPIDSFVRKLNEAGVPA